MKVILTLVLAAMIAPAATITYVASSSGAPTTTGNDPCGTPWNISVSGGNAVFSLIGPLPWNCPGCLTDVTISALGLFGGLTTLLQADLTAPHMLHNATANNFYNYDFPSPGNVVHFDIAPGAEIAPGDLFEAKAYFLYPNPSASLLFVVTYETADCETPEPGSFALLGAGMIGLALIKRRRLANQ